MVSFRKLFPVLVVIGLLLTVSTASAQLTCSDPTAMQARRLVRAEGLTELVSPIRITCGFAGGAAAGTAAPGGFSANFELQTSQNVTSTLTSSSNQTVAVRLRVIENGAASINTTTGEVTVTGGTTLATKQGVLVTNNVVDWNNVAIPYTSAATNVQVIIDNIRVNAGAVENSFSPIVGTIKGVSSGATISEFSVDKDLELGVTLSGIANNRAVVGTTEGSTTTGGKASLDQCTTAMSGDASLAGLQTRVVVTEGFGNSFKAAEVTGYEAGLGGFTQHATRIRLLFSGIPAGTAVYVSNSGLVITGTSTTYNAGIAKTGSPSGEVSQVTLDATGAGFADFEVTNVTTAVDSYVIGVGFKFGAGTSSLGTGQVAVELAPIDATATSITDKSLVPRFKDITSGNYRDIVTINACTTTLLFPYVTSAGGWDTGIAISNTTADVKLAGSSNYLFSGSDKAKASQSGTCSLYYFGAPTTAAATTAVSVPAGGTFLMTLSGGSVNTPNAFNVTGVAGFTGYMIAQCNFQNAHGFAFLNGTASSGSAGVGYTALVMNGAAASRVTGTSEALLQ